MMYELMNYKLALLSLQHCLDGSLDEQKLILG